MSTIIKSTTISSDDEEVTIRQMDRLLFPYRDRLIIVVNSCFQIKYNLLFLEELNRSIVLVCNFVVETNLIENISENINIIDFSLIDIADYSKSVRIYLDLLSPTGTIMFDDQNLKNNIWHEQSYNHNLNIFIIKPKEIHNFVSMINKKFPYRLSHGKVTDKLFVGCDKYFIDGWLNTDLREGGEVKYLDISKKLPFEENEFQYIFIEDALEYLEIDKCMYALSEIYKILKHGGRLRISLLNIYFIVDLCLYSEKVINKKYIEWVIENNKIENLSNIKMEKVPVAILDWFINKNKYVSFYDMNAVKIFLEECGFREISYFLTGESGDSVFINVEQQIFTYPVWVNQLQYVSLEAVKL